MTSPRLLEELDGVLRREKFRRYVDDTAAEEYVAAIGRESLLLDDPEPPTEGIGVDPDDEYLLSLARAASAVLVSGDAHLLGLPATIPVIGPAGFLDSLD